MARGGHAPPPRGARGAIGAAAIGQHQPPPPGGSNLKAAWMIHRTV